MYIGWLVSTWRWAFGAHSKRGKNCKNIQLKLQPNLKDDEPSLGKLPYV